MSLRGEITVEFMIYFIMVLVLIASIYFFYFNERRLYGKGALECQQVTDAIVDSINQGYSKQYYSFIAEVPNHECNLSYSGGRLGCISEKCDYYRAIIHPVILNGPLSNKIRITLSSKVELSSAD